MVLELITVAFAFIAVLLFALWLFRGVGQPADGRMRALAMARQRGEGVESLPFQERVVVPLVESLGRSVASLLPGAFVSRTERRLVLAGQPMRPTTFYTLVLGLGALLAGAYLLLVLAAADGAPPPLALLPGVFVGVVGMYVVSFWLSAQARSRQSAMLKGLPDS